jgi:hypothetical protein
MHVSRERLIQVVKATSKGLRLLTAAIAWALERPIGQTTLGGGDDSRVPERQLPADLRLDGRLHVRGRLDDVPGGQLGDDVAGSRRLERAGSQSCARG